MRSSLRVTRSVSSIDERGVWGGHGRPEHAGGFACCAQWVERGPSDGAPARLPWCGTPCRRGTATVRLGCRQDLSDPTRSIGRGHPGCLDRGSVGSGAPGSDGGSRGRTGGCECEDAHRLVDAGNDASCCRESAGRASKSLEAVRTTWMPRSSIVSQGMGTRRVVAPSPSVRMDRSVRCLLQWADRRRCSASVPEPRRAGFPVRAGASQRAFPARQVMECHTARPHRLVPRSSHDA